MTDSLMPVVILAGGLATRLRPATETIPKALVPVCGEPFIAHQLRLLAARGLTRAVIAAGYLGNLLADFVGDGARFGLQADYSFDGPRLLGTAGAVRRARSLAGERFFVLYGDSYLPCDYRAVERAFTADGRPALMTVYRNDGRWDRSNVEYEAGRIISYDKAHPTSRMRYIDYGLGAFHRATFDEVPEDEPSDLADLYRALVARDELAACEVSTRFYEVGSREGIAALESHLRTRGG